MKKSVINLTQSRSKGRAAAGTHGGEKVAVGIDCKMGAGGDADKIATLDDPEVMNAMQKKYGIR